jgi:hypothetical protein
MEYIMVEGHKPAKEFDQTNENMLYWTDGIKVYFLHYEISKEAMKVYNQENM